MISIPQYQIIDIFITFVKLKEKNQIVCSKVRAILLGFSSFWLKRRAYAFQLFQRVQNLRFSVITLRLRGIRGRYISLLFPSRHRRDKFQREFRVLSAELFFLSQHTQSVLYRRHSAYRNDSPVVFFTTILRWKTSLSRHQMSYGNGRHRCLLGLNIKSTIWSVQRFFRFPS